MWIASLPLRLRQSRPSLAHASPGYSSRHSAKTAKQRAPLRRQSLHCEGELDLVRRSIRPELDLEYRLFLNRDSWARLPRSAELDAGLERRAALTHPKIDP